MRPVTEKELKFLKKWETRRQRKWRYLILSALFWGLIQSFPYFWNIDFDLAQFDPLRFISHLMISSLIGFALAWLFFIGQEKRYREVKEANLI